MYFVPAEKERNINSEQAKIIFFIRNRNRNIRFKNT